MKREPTVATVDHAVLNFSAAVAAGHNNNIFVPRDRLVANSEFFAYLFF